MHALKKKKVFSMLLVLLLMLQLLPLGTALATSTESDEDIFDAGDPLLTGDDAALDIEEPDSVISLFATGVGLGVTENLTGTDYLEIHDKSHPTQPTQISIKDKDDEPIYPDGSGNYSGVPTGAKLQLDLGFHLEDGDASGEVIYEYEGGEHFTFQLPGGITFNPTTGIEIRLGASGPVIATAEIMGEVLKVTFNSSIKGMSEISGYVQIQGTFDSIASGGGDTTINLGSDIITILRNPTDPPPPPGEINLDKNGAYDPSTGEITWTITVATSAADQDISGYKIIDTYSANQTYVDDSFGVVGHTYDLVNLDHTAPELTYTFPSGTEGPQVITYRTTPVAGFTFDTEFKNEAELRNASDAFVKDTEKTITLGSIIKKEGSDIKPDDKGIIDWTVTVKLPKASDGGTYLLPNAKIIDEMDDKLELDTSKPIQISFDGGATYADVPLGTGVEPGTYYVDSYNELTYLFPANQPYTGTTAIFKYSTKVDGWDYNMTNNNPIAFTNNARFEWWTNPGGMGPGSPITIGTPNVTKTAPGGGLVSKSLASGWLPRSAYDRTSEKSGDIIKWKIVVNGNKVKLENAYITDSVVSGHDLLISSAYPLTVKKNSDTPEPYDNTDLTGTNGTLSSITTSSFRFDFLPSPTTDTYTIEFYTQLNNDGRDAMYRGTNTSAPAESKTFQNNVTLHYDGGTANSSATKTYTLEMLNKSVKTGYNIGDHTVQWQLVVNRNMLPMTGASVADTVQEGMVIDATKPITIKPNDGTQVTLTTAEYSESGSPVNGAKYEISNSDKTLTITLPPSTSDQLTITYWTKVTDERLKDTDTAFWGTDKQHKFTNTATLKMSGKPDIVTNSEVTAKNPVITKKHDYSSSNPYEIINWEAVVNPAQIEITGGAVTDTLNGNLEFVDGSVRLYSVSINTSGQPTGAETPVSLTKDGTASDTAAAYTYAGKLLTVYLPTPTSEAYILRFQTVIIDDTNKAPITNTISLDAGATTGGAASDTIVVNEITAIGGMYTNSITVKKTDGSTENLEGAVFALLNKNGNPIKRMDGGTLKEIVRTTDSAGEAVFENLPPWVYYVKEIDPPPGYVIDTTGNVSVNGGSAISGDATVGITNTFGLADVSILKKGAGGVDLDGGVFTLAGTAAYNNLPIATRTAAAVSGVVSFSDVPIGSYTITETTAPTGHQLNSTPIAVTVGYNTDKTGTTVSYSPTHKTITNEPKTGKEGNPNISFTKYKDDGSTTTLLEGATFELRNSTGGAVVSTKTSGNDGIVTFPDISVGNYEIWETNPTAGYLNPGKIFTVEVTYTDSTYTGLQVVIKNLLGATVSTSTSLADPIAASYTNELGKAPVSVKKIGAKDGGSDVTLPGAKFTLTGNPDAFPELKYVYETNPSGANGIASFTLLTIYNKADDSVVTPVHAVTEVLMGTYTLHETSVPTNHIASSDITVKVEYQSATDKSNVKVTFAGTASNTVKNVPNPTDVNFTKVDSADSGKTLSGGTYELRGTDYTGTTITKSSETVGADGKVVFKNVNVGSYDIYETLPPDGYLLNAGHGLPSPNAILHVDVTYDKTVSVVDTTKPLVFSISLPSGAAAAWNAGNYDNTLGKHDVEIKKVGASSTPLTDGVFTLYRYSDNSVVKTATVNNGVAVPANKGQVLFENIPIGDYYIQETTAPSGHIADSTRIYVRVDYTNATLTAVQATYSTTHDASGTGYTTTIPIFTNVPINSGISGNPDVSFKKLRADQPGGTKTPLGGVTFTLRDKAGILPDATAMSASNGVVTFTDVAFGKYTIFETVPDGYLNPNADPVNTPIYTVDVSYNTGATGLKVRLFAGINNTYLDADALYDSEAAAVPLLEHVNMAAVADVEFVKLSTRETDLANPKIIINGGLFEIRGKAIAGYPTEAATGDYVATASAVNGKVTFKNVPVNATGEYTIKEITPPSGYFATTDTLKVRISYADAGTKLAVAPLEYWDNAGAPVASLSLTNDPIPYTPGAGKATVLKTDEDGKPLAGATFTLYGSNGAALASMVSGTDGLATFTNLTPDSSFTIRETAAPAGYELSSEVLTVKTGDNSVLSFTMVNKKLSVDAGAISVLKTDETARPLGGAEFTLYDKDGNAIATRVTGADGKILFNKLPVGAYTVTETRAPLGFVLDSTGRNIAVAKGQTHEVTVVNTREPETGTGGGAGRLELVKVDSDYRPLAGAEFTLFNEDGSVYARMTTGSDGRVAFTELPAGKYTIRETIAPTGYQLFTEALPIEILSSGTVLSYTLKDARLDEDEEVMGWDDNGTGTLPKTGGASPTFFLLLAGIALVATGLVLMRGEQYRPKHLKRK